MKNKTHKIVSAVVALSMVAAIALTGTLAWNSISQQALNEKEGFSNPGGRLHDDFDGTNKDVYIENFSDPANGGVPIYARIRLYEYMEIGEGAGLKTGDNQAESLVPGARLNDVSTWTPHVPGESPELCAGGQNFKFHDFWIWEMGGQTVYMPTFNMNKDSLEADINGTLEGTVIGDNTYYDDYYDYDLGENKTGVEIWDIDGNDTDELKSGNVNIQDVIKNDSVTVQGVQTTYKNNVELKGTTAEDTVTHTAKETLDAKVYTMKQWKDMGAKKGNFWVIDVDGWAYWANAIEPGTATGLLLSAILPNGTPDGGWYYGIHVEAQFATAGDWDAFYEVEDPTSDAIFLLNQAAGRLPQVTGISIPAAQNGLLYVPANGTLKLEAQVDLRFPSGSSAETYVVWTVDPSTTAFVDGEFRPTESMVGKSFTVTATSSYDSTFWTTAELYVIPAGAVGVEIGETDQKPYVKYPDNTYKEILEDGTLAAFKCAGKDLKIGNLDDKENVKVTDEPVIGVDGENYGTKFLGPDDDGIYLAVGPDGMLGTADDTRLISASEWPNDMGIPTVIIEGPTFANVDSTVQLTAKTSPVEGCEISWSLEGFHAPGTGINPTTGLLTIAENETEAYLTVVARTEGMGGVEAEHRVNVTIPTVTVSGASSVWVGKETTLSASTSSGSYNYNWELVGTYAAGTSIDKTTGKLTVALTEPASSITVKASLDTLSSVYDTHTVSLNRPTVTITYESTANGTTVAKGLSKQFNVTISSSDSLYSVVSWDVTGESSTNTKISSDGLLSVDYSESNNKSLTVKVTLNTGATDTQSVTVSNLVKIDNIDWWVVASQGDKLLLVHKNGIAQTAASWTDSKPNWAASTSMQNFLNVTFYNTLDKLKKSDGAQLTTVWNRTVTSDPNSLKSASNKVFILSEADLYGTVGDGLYTPEPAEYTAGAILSDMTAEMKTSFVMKYEWLRSIYDGATEKNFFALHHKDGTIGPFMSGDKAVGTSSFRPTMWIMNTVVPD